MILGMKIVIIKIVYSKKYWNIAGIFSSYVLLFALWNIF
ncbi:hypothetical protein LMxysn_0956 [Listeria monocytogenes]|nr:hypothetical protein LMxysn_0956 [Listeria monocytogenes]